MKQKWKLLFLALSLATYTENWTWAACPHDWDCVLADILVHPARGPIAQMPLFSLENKEEQFTTNDAVARFAAHLPEPCTGEIPKDYRQYCHKRKILYFSAKKECEKLNEENDRFLCKGFEPHLKDTIHCQGQTQASLIFCSCLQGNTSYDDTNLKGHSDLLAGCRSAGEHILFMPGGELSCAGKNRGARSLNSSDDCLQNGGAPLKAEKEALGLSRAIEEAYPTEKVEMGQKLATFNPQEAQKTLPFLTNFLNEKCKETQDFTKSSPSPLHSCLHDKLKLLASHPKPGLHPTRVLERLILSAGETPCTELAGVMKKIVNDVITPTNAPIDKKSISLKWATLDEIDRKIINDSITHINTKMPHSYHPEDPTSFAVHFRREDPGFLASFHRSDLFLAKMLSTTPDAFMRDTGTPGLDTKTTDQWKNHFSAFAEKLSFKNFDLTDEKVKEKANTQRASQGQKYLTKLPEIVAKMDPKAKEYFREYRDQAANYCSQKNLWHENPQIEPKLFCDQWAMRFLQSFIVLRFASPALATKAPPDMLQVRAKYQKEVLNQSNTIARGEDTSADAKKLLDGLNKAIAH